MRGQSGTLLNQAPLSFWLGGMSARGIFSISPGWGGEGGGLSPVFLVRLHTLVLAVADNFLRVACARSRIHAAEENISIVYISSRGLYLIHEFQGASRPHQSLCVWLLMHKEAF